MNENETGLNEAQNLKVPEIIFPRDIFTFYLSHPAVSRAYVRKWELEFEERHPKIALINPFYDVSGRRRDDILTKDRGEEYVRIPGYEWRLTQGDYIAIAFSRGILGVVDENSDKSIGTLMEFVMARVMAKSPKLCVCTNQSLIEHPWLRTHFHEIYPSFEDFEKDVEHQVARVKKKWGF